MITDLPVELVSDISAYIPLIYRPATLLSLALTCRSLYSVVTPRILYRDVRLTGEKQVVSFLKSFISELQTSDGTNQPLSQYIKNLCIESLDERLEDEPKHSIAVLEDLLSLEGLPNLMSLTLHFEDDSDQEDEDEESNYSLFPSSLWKTLRSHCPSLKTMHFTNPEYQLQGEVIEEEIFSSGLTTIRLHCDCEFKDPEAQLNFSLLPQNLEILHIHVCELDFFEPVEGSLFDCTFPRLRTLILDQINLSMESDLTTAFWKRHPSIERLEIGEQTYGSWFDTFEDGMLPNLKYLRCDPNVAQILLPHVSKTLIGLSIFDTFGAQGPYLLRKVCPGGFLPALKSLSIHRHTRKSTMDQKGSGWSEPAFPEHENASRPSVTGGLFLHQKQTCEVFNRFYIAHIAKAAPQLEELELMGTSDESLAGLTASLSLLSGLRRLIISSPDSYLPFFGSSVEWKDYEDFNSAFASHLLATQSRKYTPQSFAECVTDLANGCVTLESLTVSDKAGQFFIPGGIGARVERLAERGVVRRMRRIKAWGCIVGREEEW